jgi:hypothetical protein
MRISDAAWLLLLGLAGCSAGGPSAKAAGDVIDCALRGAAGFAHDCRVERREQDGARLLIVHHPDGGFRRFEVVDGGTSLSAADGAEALAIAANGEHLDVSIDGDRYRFPGTLLNDAGAR